ncbi:hypothetical protein BDV23DRAFT_191149 [Aspergillus alliaceus]|uniref:Acetyl-CoA synthetase-like protein n=1 Tax=Petromyces alliaceus TaxID=209559 RepID=A0A5N7BT23_PETAA|nr:hypothetical protein BDV23DRAFT_191149 [Aspergillus alliaceus]
MVFTTSPTVQSLRFPPPDSIPIGDLIFDDKYGRCPVEKSPSPFICGLTGNSYSFKEYEQRVNLLSRGLSKDIGWQPNQGTELDKVIAIFSVNTIDFVAATLATQRLGGTSLLIHPTSTATELESHLKASGCKVIFTCAPLLPTCLEASKRLDVPLFNIYLLELPIPAAVLNADHFKTVNQLIKFGSDQPILERAEWTEHQGKSRLAFLCSSSGTSGFQKLVKVSHYNVVSNILQTATFELGAANRDKSLGLLPFSHSFALVTVLIQVYRGDTIVVLPKFDMQQMLAATKQYQLNRLYLVPPILVGLVKYSSRLGIKELSVLKSHLESVKSVVIGAAPFDVATAKQLSDIFPDWEILQGYGLTEASVVVSYTRSGNVYLGSSGMLLPLVQARLIEKSGTEVTAYGTPGELVIQSPSIVLGYFNDPEADQLSFTSDGWLRTGDVAMFKPDETGAEHLFIVDRLKDMIKVKGMQVAPGDIEAQLLSHPSVADAAVIGVPDTAMGEVAKAFIVLAPPASASTQTRDEILSHLMHSMAEACWLRGGIDFIESIPKSQSGKILKAALKQRNMEVA